MSICLTVPGITNSSEDHWQSLWEREFPTRFKRVEQTEWNEPSCAEWVAKLEETVQEHGPENVILAAHSLGCIALAHWADKCGTTVKGAMLVAPSDCETPRYRETFRSTGFSPIPLKELPFPSAVIASTDDELVSVERARQFASAWGREFVNVGAKGHINPGAGYGEWAEGLELLKKLD